jgi:hypothetical protein
LIEEALDVAIQNPRIMPASLPRHPDRIERRFAGINFQISRWGSSSLMIRPFVAHCQ